MKTKHKLTKQILGQPFQEKILTYQILHFERQVSRIGFIGEREEVEEDLANGMTKLGYFLADSIISSYVPVGITAPNRGGFDVDRW